MCLSWACAASAISATAACLPANLPACLPACLPAASPPRQLWQAGRLNHRGLLGRAGVAAGSRLAGCRFFPGCGRCCHCFLGPGRGGSCHCLLGKGGSGRRYCRRFSSRLGRCCRCSALGPAARKPCICREVIKVLLGSRLCAATQAGCEQWAATWAPHLRCWLKLRGWPAADAPAAARSRRCLLLLRLVRRC